MLQIFKRFIIFYALLTILLTIDQWFFGLFNQFCILQGYGQGSCNLFITRDTFVNMAIGQRLLGFAAQSIGAALFIGTLYFLYGIIQNLQSDQTFTQGTLDKMKKMTKFYLGSIIFYPFYEMAFSFITSMHNPPGQRFISVHFGTDNLNQIFIACCLYIVFHVMKEAYRVSSEYKMVI